MGWTIASEADSMTEGESSAMSISLLCVGNEIVPKITINYTINLSFKTANFGDFKP